MKRRNFLKTLGAGGLVGASLINTVQAQTAPSVPPVASAAGYNNLVFSDEFDSPPDIGYGTAGHKWNAGLWWEWPIPDPSCFVQSGTVLTIYNPPKMQGCNLCTQTAPVGPNGVRVPVGTQFLYGYFEARMICWDWSAFWLFCWDRPVVHGIAVNPNNPMTWTNEIDIIETDGGFTTSAWMTLHSNSSGDNGVPDKINSNNRHDTNDTLVGYWHNYGLLWTSTQLTWFIDGIPVMSLTPYASTNQPVTLVLTAAPNGVNGTPSTVNPPETKIDWVRVWR